MASPELPLLSFCCVGYRHAEFLHECLESIAKIDYPAIEVIAVDDGSGDDSVARLNALKSRLPFPLEIIAQENTGNIGKNFNNALKKAKGELVAFIALDDVFRASVVLSEVQAMNERPELAFVASAKSVSINDSGIINSKQLPALTLYGMESPTVADCLELEYTEFGSFYIQGSVFRKAVVDAVGGFDEDMTGDDIVLRTKIFRFMQQNPQWNFNVIRENNVFYRMHDNNVHKNVPRQIRIVTEYLDRYWPERPNPPVLIAWANHLVRHYQFEQCLNTFALNKRALSLLKEPEIQQQIRLVLKGGGNFFKRFFYEKQNLGSGLRQITLFGFIRFSYTKKKEKQQQEKMVHYSCYEQN